MSISKLFKKINVIEHFRKKRKARNRELESLKAQTKQYVQELKPLLSSIQLYNWGSLTEGRQDWAKKWADSPGKRVLFYTCKDYSGSFYKWACAVNQYTPYAVRLVTSTTHPYGYNQDLVVPRFTFEKLKKAMHGEFRNAHENLLQLADEADVIHFKDESSWFVQSEDYLLWRLYRFAQEKKRPTIFTHYGGYARKYKNDKKYHAFAREFSARIAMTPDLNYEWFEGYYIPHSIDTEHHPYTWSDNRLITHSPSTTTRKNTDVFESAVGEVLPGSDWRYERIENVSHDECIARKQPSGLFFDQAGRERKNSLGVDDVIGWYGNSAIEAMVFGIPTIAHISEQSWAGAERAGKPIRETCPILNTGLTQDSMAQVLRRYINMSPEQRRDLSARTRQWAEDFHSYAVNGKELADVYDAVLVGSALKKDMTCV